jgi:hypothetical protein
MRRSWEGVSVYDTFDATRETAIRYPRIGQFVAEVLVPDVGDVTFEQSLADPHHFDLHGEPGRMFEMVVSVHPVIDQ